MQFLDFFDFLTNSVMMPIAALMTSLFVSKVVGVDRMEEEIRHGESKFSQKEDICRNDQVSVPNLCYYYSGQFGSKCIWVDFNVSVLGFNSGRLWIPEPE